MTVPRVLVVDDEPSICELLALVLADEGWDVKTRTRSVAALGLLEHWSADVILLDLSMPDMHAEAFLTACGQRGAGETPIILLSAARALDQQAARLGVSTWLAKPFDIDQLEMIVRQVVARNRAPAASTASGDT